MEDTNQIVKSQRQTSNVNDKINNNLVKSQSNAHNSPKFRAKFNYIQPLAASQQQLPYEQQTLTSHKTQQKFQIESYQSQTFLKLMNAPSIKVNWNSFIKIKTHNYLDDYQIVKKIDRGGFGIVYTAKSLYTQVIRAAKVIKKEDLKGQDHIKLLEQLNIMRQLDHPNIIKLYQVYDFQNQYTLILELCQGGELSSKLRNKKIPENIVRQYMKQILRTLIYLHQQNIVHRDLKPDNMLLEKKGVEMIKIIDFGLAVKFDPGQFFTNRIVRQVPLRLKLSTKNITKNVIYGLLELFAT